MSRCFFVAAALAACTPTTPADSPDEPVVDTAVVDTDPVADFVEGDGPLGVDLFPSPDTDTDEPVDTGDPDTDPPRDLSGTITWKTWTRGELVCDATLALGGDRAAPCAGCDATWDVELEPITREGSCNLNAPELFTGGKLAWAGSWTDPWRELRFRDVLLSMNSDETWSVVQRDRDKRGEAELTEDGLTWSFDRTWGTLSAEPDAYDTCDGRSRKRAAPIPAGPWKGLDDVPCDGTTVDAWTVSLAAEATLGVDTLDKDRPFDPYLWVNDESGCTVYESDDADSCTRPPPSFGCPGLTLPAGTWTVYVGSRGQCSAGAMPYVVRVDGVDDPALTLSADDEPTGPVVVHRIQASGALTILE